MRARLLDMGEVGAVRALSIPHAVTAVMGSESDPAVMLLKPASLTIAFDRTADSDANLDLEACERRRIAVVRGHLGLGTFVASPSHLLLGVALPPGPDGAPRGARDVSALAKRVGQVTAAGLAALGVEAELGTDNRVEVARRPIAQVIGFGCDGGLCGLASLELDLDGDLEAVGPVSPGERTALWREVEQLPDLPTIAEAMVRAVEAELDFELVPSMPLPREMEAMYEWERRLHPVGAGEPRRRPPMASAAG